MLKIQEVKVKVKAIMHFLENKINSDLHFIATPEGYVNYTVAQSLERYTYVYQYKDHLGNIRMSWAKDPATQNLKILEENHYYPFGLKHQGYNYDRRAIVHRQQFRIDIAGPDEERFYEYKYNGKEWQEELGLNWYDYGARNYDAAIGRWMNIDPLAEHNHSFKPYHYCSNNPVSRIDPDGICDDPNCTHGGLRKAWDRVGRFFGAWGYSENTSAEKQSTVSVGEVTIMGFGDAIVDGLRSADDFARSLEGTSTVDEDLIQSVNIGVKYSIDFKNYSQEFQFGIYSTDENSVGLYSSTTTNVQSKVNTKVGALSQTTDIFSSFSVFANANTSNLFEKDIVSNSSKFKSSVSVPTSTPINLTSSYDRSLGGGKSNSSFGVSFGGKPTFKADASIVNSSTIFTKTEEIKLNN